MCGGGGGGGVFRLFWVGCHRCQINKFTPTSPAQKRDRHWGTGTFVDVEVVASHLTCPAAGGFAAPARRSLGGWSLKCFLSLCLFSPPRLPALKLNIPAPLVLKMFTLKTFCIFLLVLSGPLRVPPLFSCLALSAKLARNFPRKLCF